MSCARLAERRRADALRLRPFITQAGSGDSLSVPSQPGSASDMWGAIRQGIAEAVPRDLRGRVVSDALALAGLAGPPETAEAVRAFVSGPLFLSLAAILGAERAHEACARTVDLIAVCGKERLVSGNTTALAALSLRTSGVRVTSGQSAGDAGGTVRPPAAGRHEVVFVGPDGCRGSFAATMRAVDALVVLPKQAIAPALAVVVEPADSAFDLSAAARRRWPDALVLAWCAAPGDERAPEGVVVVPVPLDRPEEVAVVCGAHLSARRARAG